MRMLAPPCGGLYRTMAALAAAATTALALGPAIAEAASPPPTGGTAPPPSSTPAPDGAEKRETDTDREPADRAPAPASTSGRGAFPVRGAYRLGESGGRFGAQRGGRGHSGQDIFAACGTPIVAAGSGLVSINRFHGLAGNYVVIDGRAGDHAYMHLSAPSPLAVGTSVRAGQVLGAVGATGNARGCHLHFELWTEPGYQRGGQAVDPLPFLRARGASAR